MIDPLLLPLTIAGAVIGLVFGILLMRSATDGPLFRGLMVVLCTAGGGIFGALVVPACIVLAILWLIGKATQIGAKDD